MKYGNTGWRVSGSSGVAGAVWCCPGRRRYQVTLTTPKVSVVLYKLFGGNEHPAPPVTRREGKMGDFRYCGNR